MRPSLVAAATRFLPLQGNTTGDEVKVCAPVVQVFFTWRFPGVRPTSSPALVVAKTVPSGPNAGPADPAIAPLAGCQLLTCLVARSRAQTPPGLPLQPGVAA